MIASTSAPRKIGPRDITTRNQRLTPRLRGKDSRNHGQAVEIAGAGRTGTRIRRAVELSSAEKLFQVADVFPLLDEDQCAASRNAGSDRIRDARTAFVAPFLDTLGVGQRQSADGVRRESTARRSDAKNRSLHAQNKFLALEVAQRGSSSALGRRDAARCPERVDRNIARKVLRSFTREVAARLIE